MDAHPLSADGTGLCPAPPMGWNSHDACGSCVTAAQLVADLEAFRERMVPAGYRYFTLDFCWSHSDPGAVANPSRGPGLEPRLAMDGFGRLLPAPERFPSSAGGAGLRPLGDAIHAAGAGLALHLMHGIPRQAVADRCPIAGTDATAADAARTGGVCA